MFLILGCQQAVVSPCSGNGQGCISRNPRIIAFAKLQQKIFFVLTFSEKKLYSIDIPFGQERQVLKIERAGQVPFLKISVVIKSLELQIRGQVPQKITFRAFKIVIHCCLLRRLILGVNSKDRVVSLWGCGFIFWH